MAEVKSQTMAWIEAVKIAKEFKEENEKRINDETRNALRKKEEVENADDIPESELILSFDIVGVFQLLKDFIDCKLKFFETKPGEELRIVPEYQSDPDWQEFRKDVMFLSAELAQEIKQVINRLETELKNYN